MIDYVIRNLDTLKRETLTLDYYQTNCRSTSHVTVVYTHSNHIGSADLHGRITQYFLQADFHQECHSILDLININESELLLANNVRGLTDPVLPQIEENLKQVSSILRIRAQNRGNKLPVILADISGYESICHHIAPPVSELVTVDYLLLPTLLGTGVTEIKNLWAGESWIAPTMEHIQTDTNAIPLSPDIMIAKRLRDLAIRSLSSDDCIQPASEEVDKCFNTYLDIMLTCMPRYRKKNNRTYYLPRPSRHGWFGPITISPNGPLAFSIIEDEDVAKRRTVRELILDGWLTPWKKDDGEVVVHPGSLALLYWVACRGKLRYSSTPKEFLQHYVFEKHHHWFGGRMPSVSLMEL
ncbi:MAG: hypothetical protein ABW166_06645 [Sedimenticola sp.]